MAPLIADAARVAASLVAAGLATGGYAYAAMWPPSQIFGRTLIAPARPKELALTFDDGPNPKWTPKLLDVLGECGGKGTFFLIGKYAEREAALVRRAVEEGHAVGNHSWSHPNLAGESKARVREELLRTKETIEQITGQKMRLFRPPFGGRRPVVLRVARELGLEPVMWNAMTSDWANPSGEEIAEELAQKVMRVGKRGVAANVVLHDGGHLNPAAERGPSVDAARRIAEQFGATHRLVTVEDWLGQR